MKLGLKIKQARDFREMSQLDLSQKSGVSRASIQLYEADKGNITIANLEKIANALDFGLEYFLDLSPNHQKVVSQSVSQSSKNCLPIHPSPQDLSPSMSPSPSSPPIDPNSYYIIPKLTLHAQAGGGNEILDLECYESGEMLTIDKAFFKVIPSYKLKAIKVEGYSMIPMLLPDSWVVFEERREYKGDGLYIINYAGQLMVKLLQLDPVRKILDIVSVNKEYKSYSIPLSESQVEFIIIGKVLRCII